MARATGFYRRRDGISTIVRNGRGGTMMRKNLRQDSGSKSGNKAEPSITRESRPTTPKPPPASIRTSDGMRFFVRDETDARRLSAMFGNG